MELLTARFVDQLFSAPSEIMIMDQLAEWNRQHLDARYASAQTYNPGSRSLRVVAAREFAPRACMRRSWSPTSPRTRTGRHT
jgi:hypothetical protein